jgi:hypothetical protein
MASPEEDELQRDLAECTLNGSWLFTLAGVALSVPLSLRFKSYNPVVYCGLTGTMLDLVTGERERAGSEGERQGRVWAGGRRFAPFHS